MGDRLAPRTAFTITNPNALKKQLATVAPVGVAYEREESGHLHLIHWPMPDLGQFGITANAVAPGFIATDMTAAAAARLGMTFEDFRAVAASQVPVRRIGEVDDVANTISFLVSEGAGYVSGQVIYVAGGPLC